MVVAALRDGSAPARNVEPSAAPAIALWQPPRD